MEHCCAYFIILNVGSVLLVQVFLGDGMVKKWMVDFDAVQPWLCSVVQNTFIFLSSICFIGSFSARVFEMAR